MGFDAGEIKGRISLDTTEMDHGFSEAHSHAESEGGKIREVLESIAEVASEIAGPAFAQFGQQLQSAFAGFSEGPVLGSLNILGLAVGNIKEAAEGAGATFHQMGLEAEKAGVSTEFLSRLSAVGGTVGVSLESLGVGFKVLEQRAAEAAEGNKATIKDFERLGISAQEAGELMQDPQKLFEKVQESLEKIPTHAERVSAALGVMGRQGANLIPLFAQSRDEFDQTADQLERLGGTVSDSDVEVGEGLGKLEGYFRAAWLGIEREVGKPVLQFLLDHMNEVEPKIEAFTKGAMADIGKAWKFLADNAGEFKQDGAAFIQFLKDAEPLVAFLAKGVKDLAHDLGDAAKAFAQKPDQDVLHRIGSKNYSFGHDFGVELNRDIAGRGGSPLFTGTENLLYQLTAGHVGVDPDQTRKWKDEDAARDAANERREHEQSFNSLTPALRDLDDHIRTTTDAFSNLQQRAQSGGVASDYQGGRQAVTLGTPGATVTQNITVSAAFDPTESARQFASKIIPSLRQMRDQQSQAMSGMAAQMLANATMGGVG